MDPRRNYLAPGNTGVGPGSIGQGISQGYMQYQEPEQYQHQHRHQQHNQAQELQNRRLPHPMNPLLPVFGMIPRVGEFSREQQHQQRPEINIYPPQTPALHGYRGGNETGHRKFSSWPQGTELHLLPPQHYLYGTGPGGAHLQQIGTEHNPIPIGNYKGAQQGQLPERENGRQRLLSLESYSNVDPFQRSSQGENTANYPVHGIWHQKGYLDQGESGTGHRGMPAHEPRAGWAPNHMRSLSDGSRRPHGDRRLEEAHGVPCYGKVMQTGGLQQMPALKSHLQPTQPPNGPFALQPHLLATTSGGIGGAFQQSVPEAAFMKPRDLNANHANSGVQNSNTMSHGSTTHANPGTLNPSGMLPEGHVYEPARSTPTTVLPTALAALRNGTYNDPLLMLLRAAELILGPLIPKGMSLNAKEAGGEKLTSSQKVLPPPKRLTLPNVMRTEDNPNMRADDRLSLLCLANPRRDIEALRLMPTLTEALRKVDLCSTASYVPANEEQQGVGPNPQAAGQASAQHQGHQDRFANVAERAQPKSSSDISQLSVIKKRKLENCTGQAASQTAGIKRVRYQDETPFNIFQEILKRPELTLLLAKHMRVQELLILYRTSRDFHNVVNTRFTTIIQAQARLRAPQSAKIFPPRCYAKLCIPDPGLRPHPVARRAAVGETRKVPSFRWLLMVCFRDMVCHEIITILAEDGVPVPDRCASTMKKIWLLMDIPDNARRIGLVQNREIFTDMDLFFATLFFVKLDMRFTDPITGSGKDGMRRLLLAQPSLAMLWRTLKRTALTSKLAVMRLFARWKYQPRQDQRGLSILGIPAQEVGIVQYQGWGRTGNRTPLQRPDELLLKESIRRGLELQQRYTDMFLWGYINPVTMQDYPPVVRRRRLERLEGLEEILVPVEDRGKVEVGKTVSRRVVR
ncbi:hypothetical protein AJ78_02554 [Emergomyces pasteurianus Ep9510]|uniref:Uncharacterized protein n=1 Tax=Emergomyces pasteurianus Ep9510 TaxID=1447872 RepID=A0A1J9PLR1_9EURO|nr:hypothetical protein AJ78_02554 [Emergomyces pasteurianus Ep9510]